jgi:hypothetical protein
MNKSITIILIGILVIALGILHPVLPGVLPPFEYMPTPSEALAMVGFPSSVTAIDVPFYYQDVNYLYLSPEGLCRWAVREMVIAYWTNLGYMSWPVPSQGQLVWEETNDSVPSQLQWMETSDDGLKHNHMWSYLKRGCYTEWDIGNANFVDVEGWQFFKALDANTRVTQMKYYLSKGVPFYFSFYLGSDGLPNTIGPDKWGPVANHAVVFVGYNETGFFYHNPRTPDKPYVGPDRFISSTLIDTIFTGSWPISPAWNALVAFPPRYAMENVLVNIKLKILKPDGSPLRDWAVSTYWQEDVVTDQQGDVSLKVDPFKDIVCIGYSHFPSTAHTVGGYDGTAQMICDLGCVGEGDSLTIKLPTFDPNKAIINSISYVKPQYTPPPTIATRPPLRQAVDSPGPLPEPSTIYEAARSYAIPSEWIIGSILIIVGISTKKKSTSTR